MYEETRSRPVATTLEVVWPASDSDGGPLTPAHVGRGVHPRGAELAGYMGRIAIARVPDDLEGRRYRV